MLGPPPPDWVDEEVVRRLVLLGTRDPETVRPADRPDRRPTPAEEIEVARELLARGQGMWAIHHALNASTQKAHRLIRDARKVSA